MPFYHFTNKCRNTPKAIKKTPHISMRCLFIKPYQSVIISYGIFPALHSLTIILLYYKPSFIIKGNFLSVYGLGSCPEPAIVTKV